MSNVRAVSEEVIRHTSQARGQIKEHWINGGQQRVCDNFSSSKKQLSYMVSQI